MLRWPCMWMACTWERKEMSWWENSGEGCQLSCKTQKDANFQLQTCFSSYTETCRAGNGVFKAQNGAFKARNASFEPNFSQTQLKPFQIKRDQLGVLINGVVDHFVRKVKEDGVLVITDSVERSARDWNIILTWRQLRRGTWGRKLLLGLGCPSSFSIFRFWHGLNIH